jgi:hypothetical protein
VSYRNTERHSCCEIAQKGERQKTARWEVCYDKGVGCRGIDWIELAQDKYDKGLGCGYGMD